MSLATTHVGRDRRLVALFAVVALTLSAAPVLAHQTPTDPEPDIDCPSTHGSGSLTHYVTTVETPSDSNDWYVSVQFTLAGDSTCELSLATYELASSTFTFPQTLYDSDTGTFAAGTHSLTAALPLEGQKPGCWAQYDFVFGPAVEELTFETRYGSRQIRARIVGSDECPATAVETATPLPTSAETSTPTVTASPTPTSEPTATATPAVTSTPTTSPREDVAGGTPTSTPRGGTLPDTSVTSDGDEPVTALGVMLLVSIAVLVLARTHLSRHVVKS